MIDHKNNGPPKRQVLIIGELHRIPREYEAAHQAKVEQVNHPFMGLVTKKFIGYPLRGMKNAKCKHVKQQDNGCQKIAEELFHRVKTRLKYEF